jgi:regulator of protease activity HflC (stomatin/prohibitin superfamily)
VPETAAAGDDATTEGPVFQNPKRLSFVERLRRWARRRRWLVRLLIVAALVVTYVYIRSIVVLIHAGEAGVLYRPLAGGTQTELVYAEGLHILKPYNRMYIYDLRIQLLRHEFDVLTNRGLPITVSFAIRYRPVYELLGLLHQEVGPDYPNKIILPQIESVMRTRIGQHSPEDVYTNKAGILTSIVVQAEEEVGRRFIVVDEIIIRSVTLPPEIKGAIEAKLVSEQQFLAYHFILKREQEEAKRKLIEAEGIREYQRTITESLNPNIMKWHGIEATQALSRSENAKVVIIGSGEDGLPLIIGGQ